MTKLSVWARQHPANARIIIVVLHLFLILLAMYAGTMLVQLDLKLPVFSFYICCLLFLVAVFIYPPRHQRYYHFNKRQLYIIRKSCDFILGISSFMMILFLAGKNYTRDSFSPMFSVKALLVTGRDKPTAAAIVASLSYRDKATLTRSEKRILRTEFRRQLKAYTIAKIKKEDNRAAKILLIVLAIIAAVGLTYLLAGLSCSIACGGAEGLAVLVFIAGLAGILVLLMYTIKKIKTYHKNPAEEKTIRVNEN